MSLTGMPLIVLTVTFTVAVAAATTRYWRRGGRWRLPMRVSGLLAIEILITLAVGLVVNRSEGFYPSWQALAGGDETLTVAPKPTGRLDNTLTAGRAVAWSPPEQAQWRLAGSPTLIVPVDYAKYADRTYPVIVVLTAAERMESVRAQAATTTGALTVVVVPTRDTTAADLATLPARLAQDTRAAGTGWAIVADNTHTALARQWHSLTPARFRTVTGSIVTAADRLPPALNAPVRLHP